MYQFTAQTRTFSKQHTKDTILNSLKPGILFEGYGTQSAAILFAQAGDLHKKKIKKNKHTRPDAPENESGLTKLITMGYSSQMD